MLKKKKPSKKRALSATKGAKKKSSPRSKESLRRIPPVPKPKFPSRAYRIVVSSCIVFYILFSLQISLFPGMGLKKVSFWPWATWQMFQYGLDYNQTLKAIGYTARGKTVDIDLESMFEYIGGGHRPSLLFYFEELFTELGQEEAFKNRFIRFVTEKVNQSILDEDEKVFGVDLSILTWTKNRENKVEGLTKQLSQHWHY